VPAIRLLLIAEIDAKDEAAAQRVLDAFRDAAAPSDHGVSLYRATRRQVLESSLIAECTENRATRDGFVAPLTPGDGSVAGSLPLPSLGNMPRYQLLTSRGVPAQKCPFCDRDWRSSPAICIDTTVGETLYASHTHLDANGILIDVPTVAGEHTIVCNECGNDPKAAGIEFHNLSE